jgi:transposase InsO family protein
LADEGVYVASESTFYRVLREEQLLAHRGKARPGISRKPPEHVASAPNQVWSWDITYLRGPVRGAFLYLYMVVDLYSRRIMGSEVHEEECNQRAAALARRCFEQAGSPQGLILHSDNGGPMKGATMLATLQNLGIAASFSRPRVSDDNPFSEALFRTLKYRPCFPDQPFEGLEQARAWVTSFVAWYNTVHLHSALNFVTPEDRYFGREGAVLTARQQVYTRAQRRHPERWSGELRDWSPTGPVRLNPSATSAPALGAYIPQTPCGSGPDRTRGAVLPGALIQPTTPGVLA